MRLTTPHSAATILIVAFLAAYAGDAGHGFIKDDFRWIRETRLEAASDAPRLFMRSDGFYRPVVALMFAANSATAGIEPRAYGFTNLVLILACALLLFLLARHLQLPAAAALVAAGVWMFNFHGINMAILWISGRTASILTLASLATALAFVSDRRWLAGSLCLLALLSKEEAVLLPAVFSAWSAYDAGGSWSDRLFVVVRRTWPCWVVLAVYFALRLQTDAFWPASAPSYYRLTLSPSQLLENVVQYADRAVTWPAVTALILFAASGWRARVDRVERRVAMFGLIWLVGTFALTVLVPVRSSLYAVLPSAGAALAAGAVASATLRAEPSRVGVTFAALALLPFFLVPVYWSRNERWVRLADVSTTVLEQVAATHTKAPHRAIVLIDNPSERFNLDAAFGALWPDAAALCVAPEAKVAIGPIAPDGAVALRLENGRLRPEN